MSETPSEQPSMVERLDFLATGGGDRGYAFLTEDAMEMMENTTDGRQDGTR